MWADLAVSAGQAQPHATALSVPELVRQCFARGLSDLGWEQAIEAIETGIMPLAPSVNSAQPLQLLGPHWHAWDAYFAADADPALRNLHHPTTAGIWQTPDVERVFNACLGDTGIRTLTQRLSEQAPAFAIELTLVRECLHHWRVPGAARVPKGETQ